MSKNLNKIPEQTEPDDSFLEDQEIEFQPCAGCDGHDACEDFGCAFELGLGHMVNKNEYNG